MTEKSSFEKGSYNSKRSLMEIIGLNGKTEESKTPELSKIIFVLKGSYSLQSNLHGIAKLKKGEAIFIPKNCEYKESGEESLLLIMQLDPSLKIKVCDCACPAITNFNSIEKESSFILKINDLLEKYLKNLCQYLYDEVDSPLLYEIKIKELIYILTQSYPTSTIDKFFLISN